MPITRVGTASVSAAASSSAITPPTVAGTAAGDLIVCAASTGRPLSSFTNQTYTGWTTLFRDTSGNGNLHGQLIYRIANGTAADDPPSMAYGTNTAGSVAITAVYRGVDGATPFIAQNFANHAPSGDTIFAPAITNNSAGAWGVYYGAYRSVASPARWTTTTPLVEHQDADAGISSSNNAATIWADTDGNAATGTISYSAVAQVSINTDNGRAWAGFLNPAASGGAFAGPDHIADGSEMYSPVVGGSLTVAPGATGAPPVLYAPTAAFPGQLSADHIADTSAIYAPAATANLTSTPGHIARVGQAHNPSTGNVIAPAPGHIARVGTMHAPSASGTTLATPDLIVAGPTLYQPTAVTNTARDLSIGFAVAARTMAATAAARSMTVRLDV